MALLRKLSLRTWRTTLLTAALWSAAAAADPGSRTAAADEREVKAAFLLNFAAFVEWPANAFGSPTDPIVVGVYGADPFGATLEAIFSGETVRGRPFLIKRIPSGGDVSGCHIVFVSDPERPRFPSSLGIRNRPILTVANAPNFAERGGIVEFMVERGRIRFRINRDAARAAGLTIGSKLLRLAAQ